MNNVNGYIDLQIESNRSKNMFHPQFGQTARFTKDTLKAIPNLDSVVAEDLNLLIDYIAEKVLQEFCRVNQYFSFQKKEKAGLKEIYRDLYQELTLKKNSVEVICHAHYGNLKTWLEKTNPFLKELYIAKDPVLGHVACSEYSATLQRNILRLDKTELLEPILDIGCGQAGGLVKELRKNGLEAYGIDRFSDDSLYLEKSDWLEFDYGAQKWGTIVSNLGFSNHFVHHHLREDGNFLGYATKYMHILESLRPGGCFCYAPDLPFIEKYLDRQSFSITKYDIENSPFKTTTVKRLK